MKSITNVPWKQWLILFCGWLCLLCYHFCYKNPRDWISHTNKAQWRKYCWNWFHFEMLFSSNYMFVAFLFWCLRHVSYTKWHLLSVHGTGKWLNDCQDWWSHNCCCQRIRESFKCLVLLRLKGPNQHETGCVIISFWASLLWWRAWSVDKPTVCIDQCTTRLSHSQNPGNGKDWDAEIGYTVWCTVKPRITSNVLSSWWRINI